MSLAVRPIPLTLHTAYAELLERAQLDAFDRDFPPNGTFVSREVAGRIYWYFNQHQARGRTGGKGGTRQKYVGQDSPELRARIERHGQDKQAYRDRRSMVNALRKAGLGAPTPLVGDLLEALSNAGVFRLRACVIGTAAFQAYSALLGVKLGATAAATTEDLDLAQFLSISVGVEDTTPPLLDIVRSVDDSFRSVPYMAEGHRTRALRNRDGFRVELLVPNRGSNDFEGRPVALPALGETDGLSLRFLDHLIYDEVDAVVLHKAGILVKVPRPGRFAVHKLIVAARRRGGNPKSPKDVAQAELLIEALNVTRRGDELIEAWDDAWKRGRQWQQHLSAGAGLLSDSAKEMLPARMRKIAARGGAK